MANEMKIILPPIDTDPEVSELQNDLRELTIKVKAANAVCEHLQRIISDKDMELARAYRHIGQLSLRVFGVEPAPALQN